MRSNVDTQYSHYETEEASTRLEAVLADAQLTDSLRMRIAQLWEAELGGAASVRAPPTP